jgi:hypothetical protein
MTKPVAMLLKERNKTHGDFEANARISQKIKHIIAECDDLPDVHREALDMIALKMSRILSGHYNFKDHWLDISGYANLALDACDE